MTRDTLLQNGKLAVVNGANSGIGWHSALALAPAGSEVILTARTDAKGPDAVAREITEDGFKKQFGTNFLGPFALTMLLLTPRIRVSRGQTCRLQAQAAR